MPSKDSSNTATEITGQPLWIPDTHWYQSFAAAGLRNPLVHGELRYWLTLEGSLTRALQLRCESRFQVTILREGFARPSCEESQTLNIPARQNAWIREVCLSGDGTPWVLARTIIPLPTLNGRGRRLRHLGRRPLGAYLFSNPEWQRGPFETGLCQAQKGEQQALQPIAARRSRFFSGNNALLVGEYFLPSLCQR